jgi:hypothetical protein
MSDTKKEKMKGYAHRKTLTLSESTQKELCAKCKYPGGDNCQSCVTTTTYVIN